MQVNMGMRFVLSVVKKNHKSKSKLNFSQNQPILKIQKRKKKKKKDFILRSYTPSVLYSPGPLVAKVVHMFVRKRPVREGTRRMKIKLSQIIGGAMGKTSLF